MWVFCTCVVFLILFRISQSKELTSSIGLCIDTSRYHVHKTFKDTSKKYIVKRGTGIIPGIRQSPLEV